MSDRIRRLGDQIRKLKPSEQADLRRLLDDLTVEPEHEIERVWFAEARRRSLEIEAEQDEETSSQEDSAASRERVANLLKRKPS